MAHQLARWLLWLVVVLESCLELVSGDWAIGARSGQPTISSSLQLKHKRQVALDLAFSRLRILESLDGQLRHWTAEVGAGEPHLKHLQRQQQVVCRLPLVLDANPQDSQTGNTCPPSQVPPYMLNLQRMIVGQASSQAEAVRLMPYGSLVARSFRQPQPNYRDDTPREHGSMHQAMAAPPPGNAPPVRQQQQLVVELSLLGQTIEEEQEEGQRVSGIVEPVVSGPTSPFGCKHLQLCYWFPLHRKLAERINGSLDFGQRERLVEAELHLYKLAPKLLLASPSTPRLKTDLLEVSLYQILARGAPERLLDIRRIDLHSIGWETFYVRRALKDWVQEPALNLGLVIKAKSMFKEPIGPGLVRFADLEPHQHAGLAHNVGLRQGTPQHEASIESHQDDESWQFNLSHQPTLVIYTTIES